MVQLSANLGFLWADLPLANAIRLAAAAGFRAVECHYPYDEPAAEVALALRETGLPMVSLNTRKTMDGLGGFGLAALPNARLAARAAIVEALDYAVAIGARNVHVLAGATLDPQARATYLDNLAYAAAQAARSSIGILIEPINHRDMPDYHLLSVEDAVRVIAAVGAPNLRLLFDCYHVQIIEGDLVRRLERFLPWIGHVQIAAVPDRGEPDQGEVDYGYVLSALGRLGYRGMVGAEYRPRGETGAGLGWMAPYL
jgi:hydroxypyruvate isomerase